MKIAHLFAGGNIGGIECLCRDYTKMSKYKHIVLVLWGDGPVLDEIKENGIKVRYLQMTNKSLLTGYRKVLKICLEEQVDVIVAEHEAILSHIILCQLKMIKSNLKTVVYAHCHASFMCRENEKKSLWFRKLVLSTSLKKADCVIAISECVKKSLTDYFGVDSYKVRVIYNGILFPKEGILANREDKLYKIVYVGRLIKEKGVQTIIEAVKMLGNPYHLDVVGDGPYRYELEKKSLGIEKNISFHGFQSDVYRFLCAANLFVHVPDCEEGFGLTVAEAMAMGMVCIVGNRGAMGELIEDQVNGFLIQSGDAGCLMEKIKYVSEKCDISKLDSIRKSAREKAVNYSMDSYVKMVDEVLLEITE